jgi:hypothetical protein
MLLAGPRKRFMANIPGAINYLPGVFGPTTREIIKTDKGYAIGWAPIKSWGEPNFEGSVRDIAKFIVLSYAKTIPSAIDYRIPYFGVFDVSFKPEVTCSIAERAEIGEGVDAVALVQELTAELEKLKILVPFA